MPDSERGEGQSEKDGSFGIIANLEVVVISQSCTASVLESSRAKVSYI